MQRVCVVTSYDQSLKQTTRETVMFTGIIGHCGKIIALERSVKGITLTIHTDFNDLQLGESIAVDGVCLTVTAQQPSAFCCDISPETIVCSCAQHYQLGDHVHLERALRLSDRLSGHLVAGHVDQTAKLVACRQQAEFLELQLGGITGKNRNYLIPKGSVAVNGVSLTINKLTVDGFMVMLIPHTLQKTALGNIEQGQTVNIEFDAITKTIVHTTQEDMKNAQTI